MLGDRLTASCSAASESNCGRTGLAVISRGTVLPPNSRANDHLGALRSTIVIAFQSFMGMTRRLRFES